LFVWLLSVFLQCGAERLFQLASENSFRDKYAVELTMVRKFSSLCFALVSKRPVISPMRTEKEFLD
jgi:hypothetical protein